MSPEHPVDSTLDPVARQILRSYPSRCQARASFSLNSGGGFSGARLWRIDAEGGIYALRAMSRATVNLDRLRGLHRLLAHVRDRGLDDVVSVPVVSTEGATFVIGEGFVWQLEPWLPGTADYALRPSILRLQNALRTLARWHAAAKSFVPVGGEVRWYASTTAATSPGLQERRRLLECWSPQRQAAARGMLLQRSWPEFDVLGLRVLELFPRVAPVILRQLRLGSSTSVPLQPCLRDVWHDHVLFSGDGVSGLIDAHSCRSECVATDLARLLGSLVLDDRQAWDLGIEAYCEIRPLDLEERGLIEIFDQSAVLLNGLTWLEWHGLDRRRVENAAAVVERLQAIVGRLETLSRRL